MTKPIRIQRSRKHKQVSPNGLPIVYVGRPGKWGNPFKVAGETGHWFVIGPDDNPLVTFYNKEKAIESCTYYFKECLLNNAIVYTIIDEIQASIQFDRFKWIAENLKLLRGKNLSCWCSLSCKCHADVLLEIANK